MLRAWVLPGILRIEGSVVFVLTQVHVERQVFLWAASVLDKVVELGWISNEINVDVSRRVNWLPTFTSRLNFLELWLQRLNIATSIFRLSKFFICIFWQKVWVSCKNSFFFIVEVVLLKLLASWNCLGKFVFPFFHVVLIEGWWVVNCVYLVSSLSVSSRWNGFSRPQSTH